MIRWVNKKNIDFDYVNNKLSECIESRHFTNFGKNVFILEDKIREILKISDDKDIVSVCNGANGLTALVSTMCSYYNKKLKFVVQNFTFPCSRQMLLQDSLILDLDENLEISIKQLENVINEYDGLILTNCFGHSLNVQKYVDFCDKNNKILLFDNAATPYTFYNNSNVSNYGNGSIISLHHTKPIGFGEGGLVIIDKKYSKLLRKIICFGYDSSDKFNYDIYASNFKMSEINAIYILQWLNNFDNIVKKHMELYTYFNSRINKKYGKLFPNYSDDIFLTSCIPFIFTNVADTNYFIENNIEAKKYYYPLNYKCIDGINASDIFNRIICFPLNMDMSYKDIDYIIDIIHKYVVISNTKRII